MSSILLRGTEKYPSSKLIERRLDELYGSDIDVKFLRFGNVDTLNIVCEFLASRYTENSEGVLSDMLEVINELLFCPLIDGEYFRCDIVEREKKNVIDGIKAVINNPDSYAGARCVEIMKRNDVNFTTLDGAVRRIEGHDRKSIYNFFEKLKSTAEVRIYYIGNATEDWLIRKISGLSEKFPGDVPQFSPPVADEPVPFSETSERMRLTQGKLAIGLRAGVGIADGDFYSAVIFNEILGASPSSRFFKNVREKYGLCYYCDSMLNIYTGNILVTCGINPENRQKALDAVFREIYELKKGRISLRELEIAKKSVINYYRQIYDKTAELFTFYTGRKLNGIDTNFDACIEKFAGVTMESVIKIARSVVADTVYFLEGGAEGSDVNA